MAIWGGLCDLKVANGCIALGGGGGGDGSRGEGREREGEEREGKGKGGVDEIHSIQENIVSLATPA